MMRPDYIPKGQPLFYDLEPYVPYQTTMNIPVDMRFKWHIEEKLKDKATVPTNRVCSSYASCQGCVVDGRARSMNFHKKYCVGQKPLPEKLILDYYPFL